MSSSPRPADTARPSRSGLAPWVLAFGAVGALLIARNLSGLDSAPVGAYVDETSIGYNAWTISRFGVDEHGAHLPLYFTAFGEFKNPVYVYVLSALLRVMPLTVTTTRLPAALFGMLTCLFLSLLAWQRSRSRAVTLFVLCLAALTPWLTVESRLGFEVVSILAAVSAALWCLSVAVHRDSWRWYAACGCALAVAVYSYSTGRVAVLLFTAALAVTFVAVRQRLGAWLWMLPPVVTSYGLLLWWNAVHPGALTARFDLISIGADGAPLATLAARFVTNYGIYFGSSFLFIDGDSNPRHATQFGGMLLWVMLPLLGLGVGAAWRRRHDPYVVALVLMVVASPVSAAVTAERTPHSLRASVMLPVLLALAIEGLAWMRRAARSWRWILGAATLLLALQGTLFTVDLYGGWPARSAADFDAGEIDAISRAAAMSHGHLLLLSDTLDVPYIDAAFALQPPPPRQYVADSATLLLAELRMAVVDPSAMTGAAGTIAVLSAGDPVPLGAVELFHESAPAATVSLGRSSAAGVTVTVYRLG